MNNKDYHLNYFKHLNIGIENISYFKKKSLIESKIFFKEINKIFENLKLNNSRVYFFGNGASSAFANHMALDFSKNGKINSRSLSDSALVTALSNDFSFENIFVEFLNIENIKENDFVITISSSGNSKNIVNVLKYCKRKKIRSLALTGLNINNKSKDFSDYSLFVPLYTYGMVECIHQIILHLILDKFIGINEWNKEYPQNMNSMDFKL